MFGIAISICIYRVFFHKLKTFPGPVTLSLTSWYTLRYSIRGAHLSEGIENLHQKYGDYVRIGPNKLSIIDPVAVKAIYGRSTPTGKGPFYNITYPRTDLHTTRDKADHARRRKHWDRGLSAGEVRNCFPTIRKHAQLEARKGTAFNVHKWFDLFGFDLLFDVGFGKELGCLVSGIQDFYVSCTHETLYLMGFFIHTPWVIHSLGWMPSLAAKAQRFQTYSEDIVHDRLLDYGNSKQRQGNCNIFDFIFKAYEELPRKGPKEVGDLMGEADLLVLAGADSMAVSMANVLYYLALDPSRQDYLRSELAVASGSDSSEALQLKGNAYLDAVINESWRLNPLGPASHERLTPDQGMYIGDRYIPGAVTVFVPNYTTWRDPRFFSRPLEFVPERWTSRPELNHDSSVFVPFQMGAHACPGRTLAMVTMRTVLADVVRRYKIYPGSPRMKEEFMDARDDKWLLAVKELNVVLVDAS